MKSHIYYYEPPKSGIYNRSGSFDLPQPSTDQRKPEKVGAPSSMTILQRKKATSSDFRKKIVALSGFSGNMQIYAKSIDCKKPA